MCIRDRGYTKLVYFVNTMYEPGTAGEIVTSNERTVDVNLFEEGSDESTWSIVTAIIDNIDNTPVSYTHLDVYKRQGQWILSKYLR